MKEGLGPCHLRGQYLHPAQESRELTAHQGGFRGLLDQARSPRRVPCSQRVIYRLADQAILLVPGTRRMA